MELTRTLNKYLPRDLTRIVNEYAIHHREEWTRNLMQMVFKQFYNAIPDGPWNSHFLLWCIHVRKDIRMYNFSEVVRELEWVQNEIDCNFGEDTTPYHILMVIECAETTMY